jgi:hypothetical protein
MDLHSDARLMYQTGDEDEKEHMEQLVDDMVAHLRGTPDKASITAIAVKNLRDEAKNETKRPKMTNALEGRKEARQLSETAEAFVKRVPPSVATQLEYGPWLWAYNPFGTREGTPDVATYKQEAGRILESLSAKRAELEDAMKGKAAGAITRRYNPFKAEAEKALVECARKNNVLSGKWMLFPPTEHVDATWQTIVEATIAGDLGIGAKVATDDGGDPRKGRLVCIYTRDFADVDDVTRVLRALIGKGHGKGERAIYYKCGMGFSL